LADIYGSDISTFAGADGSIDIDPLFRPITGPRVVLECVARRLMTPSGTCPGADAMGYDLMGLLGKRMTRLAIERAKQDIAVEAGRDERVISAKVVEFRETAKGSGTFIIRIALELATGPFILVLQASQVSVELLQADQG
jgi:hypothetical protein